MHCQEDGDDEPSSPDDPEPTVVTASYSVGSDVPSEPLESAPLEPRVVPENQDEFFQPPVTAKVPLESPKEENFSENVKKESAINLSFLESIQNDLIQINNPNESNNEVCEIDSLIDRLVPPNFEVTRNIDVTALAHVAHINQTFAILERILKMTNSYRETLNPLITRFATRFSFLIYEIQLSPICLNTLLEIGRAMGRSEFWAFKCE